MNHCYCSKVDCVFVSAYMKSKKARYGIKKFELCTHDGYVLNIEIFQDKTEIESNVPKLQSLVLRLLGPF